MAIIQVREGLQKVLCEYVDRSALTISEAIQVVQDIFFNTSNHLYGLNLLLKPIDPPDQLDLLVAVSDRGRASNLGLLRAFLAKHPCVRYLRLQWLDYTATLRVRVLPIKQALASMSNKSYIKIVQAVFGLLQNDFLCPGFSPTSVYNLYPQNQSLRLGSREGYATVKCEFQQESGEEVPHCPRTILRNQVEKANTHGMSFLIGFEVEIVFMDTSIVDGEYRYATVPINSGGHAWSTARALQEDHIIDLLEAIHDKLERAEINLEQFHPENCPGQYEFILSPLAPLEAVDTLLAAHEIISSTAANAGLRATLYPKPLSTAAGNGAHAHLSFTPADKWQSFYAGVLGHLKAIAAFTYSNEASYERVVDGAWAGSTWIAWGTQNREVPLRRVEGSHFEMKCIDGLSNPYLALAAIIGVGLQGVLDNEPLNMKDCQVDPSTLSPEERKEIGITQRFPSNINEALSCLDEDRELWEIMGESAVEIYINVKRTENEMLGKMDVEKRKNWLIERY